MLKFGKKLDTHVNNKTGVFSNAGPSINLKTFIGNNIWNTNLSSFLSIDIEEKSFATK